MQKTSASGKLTEMSGRIFLINVGTNASHGFCSPIFEDRTFEFLPIPEDRRLPETSTLLPTVIIVISIHGRCLCAMFQGEIIFFLYQEWNFGKKGQQQESTVSISRALSM